MVRVLDQVGNVMPFFNQRIHVEVNGPASIIGPSELSLRAGTTGFWLRSNGQKGLISAKVIGERLGIVNIEIQAQ